MVPIMKSRTLFQYPNGIGKIFRLAEHVGGQRDESGTKFTNPRLNGLHENAAFLRSNQRLHINRAESDFDNLARLIGRRRPPPQHADSRSTTRITSSDRAI